MTVTAVPRIRLFGFRFRSHFIRQHVVRQHFIRQHSIRQHSIREEGPCLPRREGPKARQAGAVALTEGSDNAGDGAVYLIGGVPGFQSVLFCNGSGQF